MPTCVNHPFLETTRTCEDCRIPYCDACRVEFLGRSLCGACRDRRLAEMQGPGLAGDARLAGTGTVDAGGWLSTGWTLVRDDLPAFAVASLLAGVLSMISCGLLYGAAACGLLMMAYRKMTVGTVDVGNLFDGFRRFGSATLFTLLFFLAALALGVAVTVPVLAVGAVAGEEAPVTVGVNLLMQGVSTVASLLLEGVLFFSLPHIAARNASPIEAVEASYQVFRRNWLLFSLCALLFRVIAAFGVVACCVGVFVSFPLVMAATATAYRDHFGIPAGAAE